MTRVTRPRVRLGMGGGCIGILTALSVSAAWPITVRAVPYVYVANAGEGSVAVVDAATDTVTATIPVGAYTGLWPVDPVVNPTGTRVYVAVHNAVVVIDATTNTVLKGITEGVQPSGGLAIDPSGAWLYVVNYTDPSSVSVVNTITNKVAAIIFGVGRGSTHMAVSPDGTRGYVTNTIDDNEMHHCRVWPDKCPLTVDVLDLTRNALLDIIPDVGAQLRGIVVDSAGEFLYVAQWDDRRGGATGVAIVSAPQAFLLDRVLIRAGAYDIAVNPNGTRVYAVGEHGFFAVDTSTRTVTAEVSDDSNSLGEFRFFAIALNQSGTRAYVTRLVPNGFDPDQLLVIDTSANAIIDTLTVGNTPYGVAVGPDNPPFSPPPTSTFTPTATPTPTHATVCAGDCDNNRIVTVGELVRCVNIALGTAQSTDCPACDADSDGTVTIDEVIGAVNNALTGCLPLASPIPTPTSTFGGCGEVCDERPCHGSFFGGFCVGRGPNGCLCEGPTFTPLPTPTTTPPS